MTRYTVTWHPRARDELARIWLRAPDRTAVSVAANRIDTLLGGDPEKCGAEFYGDRLLVELPLAVTFAVFPEDRSVQVLQVWHR
jgi:plasmid stabilization system protein ParE